jgi:hypothetical protein
MACTIAVVREGLQRSLVKMGGELPSVQDVHDTPRLPVARDRRHSKITRPDHQDSVAVRRTQHYRWPEPQGGYAAQLRPG